MTVGGGGVSVGVGLAVLVGGMGVADGNGVLVGIGVAEGIGVGGEGGVTCGTLNGFKAMPKSGSAETQPTLPGAAL